MMILRNRLNLFLIALLTLIPSHLIAATALDELLEQTSRQETHSSACYQFNQLNSKIRDGNVKRSVAQSEMVRLLSQVRDEYYRSGGVNYGISDWVFPLSGYDQRAIGRGRQHGFVSRGYDYFRGNRHGAHPSYDIFIHDRNQDSLDDRSGKTVNVLSLTGGIVVAIEKEWEPGSRLLGGKYLWMYDPANELLVYYAHNGTLAVGLGDVVRPGDVVASVGRSGWNAAKRRSPTHLHLTVLRVENGKVTPMKAYQALQRARVIGGTYPATQKEASRNS